MTLNLRKFILKNKDSNTMASKKKIPQDVPGTLADRVINKLTLLPTLLVKTLYVLPFLLFGLWLLQLLYFPQIEASKLLEVATHKEEEHQNIFKEILHQKDPVTREHFHMVDEYITETEHNPPLCLTCHGTYPHSKEKKVRAILNLHTGFIACAVCHARKEQGNKSIDFMWVDHETREMTTKVKGGYGKYPSKIFPIQILAGGQKKIFRPVDDKMAQQYLLHKDQYTPDQVAQVKIKLHEGISSKPVFCSDCHQKDGYLDFAKLGFSTQRINHLNSTEVVGMIEKYKTFYLPSAIDFGVENSFEK